MIGFYNLSLQGDSHKSSDKVCQDASDIIMLSNGWVVAVIADGLGSAQCSDVGSATAVQTVIDFLNNFSFDEWNVQELCDALKNSYYSAKEKIKEISLNNETDVSEYDTTLTAAIFNGHQIVYAHVGDGGIIELLESGEFIQLTAAQKGEEFNCVEPLRHDKAWSFGFSDENVCSFAMFTDGIYDVVCPWLLASENQKIYINYIRPFIDMNVINATSEDDFKELKENAKNFLLSDYNSVITDDKTVAVVVNTDKIPDVQPDSYYIEPDWEALSNENRKKLYSNEQTTG